MPKGIGDSVAAIVTAIDIARRAQIIAKQNFTLAVAYNVLAVPLAMLGLVSPLLAAVAMSTSTILVISNALRLGIAGKPTAARLANNPERAPMTEAVQGLP